MFLNISRNPRVQRVSLLFHFLFKKGCTHFSCDWIHDRHNRRLLLPRLDLRFPHLWFHLQQVGSTRVLPAAQFCNCHFVCSAGSGWAEVGGTGGTVWTRRGSSPDCRTDFGLLQTWNHRLRIFPRYSNQEITAKNFKNF